jgi:hypothetical protein
MHEARGSTGAPTDSMAVGAARFHASAQIDPERERRHNLPNLHSLSGTGRPRKSGGGEYMR